MKYLFALLICISLCACDAHGQQLKQTKPENVELSSKQLLYADTVIQKSIDNEEIPGAVLAVVKDNKIAYIKAYGYKEIYPNKVSMETNAVFDLASLTKPIATATSVMILIERGLLRLPDKVNLFIPNFAPWIDEEGKSTDIRVVDLLTHTSGLPPYAPTKTLVEKFGLHNRQALINYIDTCKRDFEPTTNMQYSCLNYVILQEIIEQISKKNLRDFAKENIFDILGMAHTDFKPSGDLLTWVVPTEKQKDASVFRGVVHDPIARELNGGISGNAGLFSDVYDLALFVSALQNGGEINGKRILSPLSVKAMRTTPRNVSQFGRVLGWDIFSPYASNHGDLLSPNTYGHTGYTGTSIVIDPDNDISIILLTNRVHPNDTGNVVRLRSLVANTVAASIIK